MSSTALAPMKSAQPLVASSSKADSSAVANQPAKQSAPTATPQKTPASPQILKSTPTSLRESGRWLHPRMDEVIQRRNKTNFDNSNIKAISVNVGCILAAVLILSAVEKNFPQSLTSTLQPWLGYTVALLCLLFTTNIGLSLLPLFRKPDNCEDIPLTPSQRKLLGLPPMSRSATPLEQQQYVTPPRFSRSATPRSSSSSLRAEMGDSPLSGRDGLQQLDNSLRASISGSPFGSPSGSERRKLSYTSPRGSPLSVSEFDTAGNLATPTKSSKASVGLNNKWLYEKGRGSPRGSPLSSASRSGLFS